MSRWTEVLAGAGLGCLMGLMLGLAATPVVASALAALTALLAAFFGLVKAEDSPDRALRIGSFGAACSLALLLGLGLRTHDLLSPSIRAEVRQWTDAGFEEKEARAMVAFQRLGIAPPDSAKPADRPAKADAPARPQPGTYATALFASTTDMCGRIVPLPDEAVLDLFRHEPERIWQSLAAAADRAPTGARPAILDAIRSTLCG
ncbi:hypothetical protein MVG78_00405 [Roseomonas gilardii subsp. gilardii]|uniref:hypothetical protein n=1 Tax=Roseomonas gilardii TaxID=257708 RepID=UPI001FFA3F3F|nr:hypothetical protein [Roseomonas gilardii]UPG72699.1 hypothetical protein MVG78_00405 [Roseomonas gilardii subsp. gilardii]